MFNSISKRTEEEEEEEEEEAVDEELEVENGRRCGKGHSWRVVVETSQGGIICLACFSALLSDPSSPSHHVSYALSQISSFLDSSNSLVLLHHHDAHRLLVPSLVRALFCYSFTRDETLAQHLVHLISSLSHQHHTDDSEAAAAFSGHLIMQITDQLSSSTTITTWNPCQIYALHCLGILLDSQRDGDPTSHIRGKTSLFSNLVAGLRLPSEEIRGEVLFVLFKLSDIHATPWEDANYDNNEGADSSFTGLKLQLLRLSLEALHKTQHDDVRLNCLALLTVLAQRGFFGILLAASQSGTSFEATRYLMQVGEADLRTPLINLFADAVKGPLLSTDTQVQIRTLDLILHSLSSDANCGQQIQIFVEENVADYVFEILRMSGNKDPLVISGIQVLFLLSTAQEAFRERLTIGFPTLLSVLYYVADIPLHPVQSQVLQLVLRCIVDCPGVISRPQIEEISLILIKIFRKCTSGEVGLQSESLMLACSAFVEILKLPSATHMKKFATMIREALTTLILSSLSLAQGSSNQLLLYALYLLKEAHLYSLDISNSENKLETGIVEICEVYLLPWLERQIDGLEEEVVVDVLETFHLILLRGSEVVTHNFAEVLASSSWFSLSFRYLGLFPSEEMKSRIYLMFSSVADRAVGVEFGHPIRDAYIHLPSDPMDLLFLLGQKSSYDRDLTCCQRAVLTMLYVSSLYGESLADHFHVLASLEQFVIVNGGNFTCGIADSIMLTQVVILYGLVRGTAMGHHRTSYSPEAERELFHLIAEQEWDFLRMGSHPISLKWLFQQEEIMVPLLNQLLNFCRSYNKTHINIQDSAIQIINIPMITELVLSQDNNMTLLLVSLLKQVHDFFREDDLISTLNVIAGILDICPEASNYFCMQGICNALHHVYTSAHCSSQIFDSCSSLVLKILSSVNHRTISEEGEWLAIAVKLLEFLNAKLESTLCDEESFVVIGIFCLVLHHSTNHVLKQTSMAILLNKSLISAVDAIVQTVSAKGPSLADEEAGLEHCLIFVLLLYFFSLKSLFTNFQEILYWKNFLQSPDDEVQQLSVICIRCHDLCRLMHFGPPLVKVVASQCLVEVLSGISEQRNINHNELRCSLNYLESIVTVIEGLVFCGDYVVAMNCAMCLSMLLRWEKLGLVEIGVIIGSKWSRLIVEELVMTLATPNLASKCLANQHKPAARIAAALLRMDKIPGWVRSVFDNSCISGIVENISAGSLSPDVVMLLRELMTRNYLSKDQVACVHHLFQVYRKQAYEDIPKETFTKQSIEAVVGIPDDIGKMSIMLFNLMLYPSAVNPVVRTDHNRLLEEIDMFFHESSILL